MFIVFQTFPFVELELLPIDQRVVDTMCQIVSAYVDSRSNANAVITTNGTRF